MSGIDQGVGIKEEKLSSVFSAFSQADSSVSRKFGGTGLGLAICRQLCELMDGTITVESEHGKGSTFSFTAIFGASSQENIVQQENINAEVMNISPIRVLLVEDNAANRFLIRVVLEKFKHDVVEAVDGIEALHIILDEQFDLILTDVQMPKLDGYRFTRIIRACEEGKELDPHLVDKLDNNLISNLRQKLHGKHRLVISMTANAMSGDKEKCFTAGMDDYLKSLGVKAERLAGKVRRDESKCFQCGACTGICSVGALYIQRPSMEVIFDPEKCTACGLCVGGCPVRSMNISFDPTSEAEIPA